MQQHDAEDTLHIAVPALTEMLFGIRTLPSSERNLRDWQRFEDLFTFHPIEKQEPSLPRFSRQHFAAVDANCTPSMP